MRTRLARRLKPRQKVILAPALPAEHWISINLYETNIRAALSAYPDLVEIHSALPNSETDVFWWKRQWLRYWSYPMALRRAVHNMMDLTAIHILDHSYSHMVGIAPTVVTCHDIANFRMDILPPHTKTLWAYRVRQMRRAVKVVAISRNTANDIVELLGIAPNKVAVNYYGVDPIFRRRLDAVSSIRSRLAEQCAKIVGKFCVIHVGSNEIRKNIPVLLRGFALFRKQFPSVVLVKVGSDLRADGFGQKIDELGIGDAIVSFGILTTEELVDVYNMCDAMAFPSLYEGFGRPVLEAQGCGLPCVLARTSSLPEVGGDAALYHEAQDAESLAVHLLRLATDENLEMRLREAGIANAARFSWDAHARALLAIYEEVANMTGGR